MIHIKPSDGFPGNHVHASNGVWAFDHNGWTKETELLEMTEQAYKVRYPEWSYKRVIVTEYLETFCSNNNHRKPWQYAYLPWERAYNYIMKFSNSPPETN